jgi:hypothetical protein
MRFLKALGRNTVWGARYGGIFGLIYSVWAVVSFVVGGQETFARQGTTIGEVIVFYLVGGAVAGAIVGMLRPLTYHRAGAALVGFLAAIPLGVGIKVMLTGFRLWTQVDRITLLLFPLFFGCGAGLVLHGIFLDTDAERRRS